MASPFNVANLDENAQAVSTTPVIVESLLAYNPHASAIAYVKLFAVASAPTVSSATPWLSIPVPAGQTIPFYIGRGVPGLYVAATTQFGAGAGAPSSDLVIAIITR